MLVYRFVGYFCHRQAPKDKKAVNTAVGRAEDICSKFQWANDQRGLGSWPLHSLHIQGPGGVFWQCIFVKIYIYINIYIER